MPAASTNYRELQHSEVAKVAEELMVAWQDPQIPQRQYEIVKPELERFRRGEAVAPYDALVKVLRRLPKKPLSILDAGASFGYYSEVLKIAGCDYQYHGIDFSPAFVEFGWSLYENIFLSIGDATALNFRNESFDIVLSSAVMMHVADYEKVIAEAARVAKSYVIMHRTPVFTERPTRYYVKEAYGVSCLEIHFNEADLLKLFAKHSLSIMSMQDVFWTPAEDFRHRTYLLMKENA